MKTLIQKDTCTLKLTGAPSIIAKTEKPKYLSTHDWIKKMQCTHTHRKKRIKSHKKKSEILLFATTRMDPESNTFSEISRRKTNTV